MHFDTNLGKFRACISALVLALVMLTFMPAILAQQSSDSSQPRHSNEINGAQPQAPATDGVQPPEPPDGQNGPPGPPPDGQDGPPGPPPDGKFQGGPPNGSMGGPPPGGGRQSVYTLSGVLSAGAGEAKSQSGGNYISERKDVSAIYAHDGGTVTLIDPAILTSGPTSSQENSSFFGLNAAVLATRNSRIDVNGGTISTSGTGANGAFASGAGAHVALRNLSITATEDGGHGVMAAGGGAITLNNVSMETRGAHGAAIATDRGGGTITATRGKLLCSGQGSPALYSTGNINVSNMSMIATGSEAAVIEGSNSITVLDSSLSGERLWGVMLYQSFSGDAEGRQSHFTMSGGSLNAGQGPLFYVTNTTGTIELSGVSLSAASGVLLQAASGRWGRKGSNGGNAILIADNQVLNGSLVVGDSSSTIHAALKNHSTLTGAIQGASLSLDATSKWTVTADSTLTALEQTTPAPDGRFDNVIGNGHAVTYDAKDGRNAWLGGKRYKLAGGGELAPKS